MQGNQPATCEFTFDELDSGRLRINRRFRPVLEAGGLATFEALFHFPKGQIVRAVGGRSTARIVLADSEGQQWFYLKRHEPPRLLEKLKPLLHFSRPILGARNEWEALLRFHAAGIPTMVPVAFGESGGRSLVMTQDLRTDRTLLDLGDEIHVWRGARGARPAASDAELEHQLTAQVAQIARRMHSAG